MAFNPDTWMNYGWSHKRFPNYSYS